MTGEAAVAERDRPARTDSVIGIDIGGTKISAARVADNGRMVGEVLVTRTPAREGPQAVLAAAEHLVTQLAAFGGVQGVGVGSAGAFDTSGRVVSATDHLVGWVDTDVAGTLSAATGLPVTALNDVHAAALGESRHGAGQSSRLLLVAIGTGLGGALVVQGRPDLGAHGLAWSIGHLPAPDVPPRRCSCGLEGHTEPWASGPGIALSYLQATGVNLDSREIGRLAAAGDPPALAAVHAAATTLGSAIATASVVADPNIVVIGGGVAQLGDVLLGRVREAYRASALPRLRDLQIRRAALGVNATMVGAADAAWDELRRRPRA